MRIAPSAADMLHALRGLGYTPATAIADLIDNSIGAGATSVSVTFDWRDGDPLVAIADNGRGMSSDQLLSAMRIGRDPREAREPGDLGRFGMGLKTASLSQGRSVTVATRTRIEDTISTARWDIDHVEKEDDWSLLTEPSPACDQLKAVLADNGTLVVWEKLDQLMSRTNGTFDAFLEVVDAVAGHLGAAFHRFLADGRLAILLNDSAVRPWDPFLSTHPDSVATATESVASRTGDRTVAFTGFTLPPASRLTKDEYDRGGGSVGWVQAQGFYVYRNDRLVVGGGWLGLGRGSHKWRADREHQLARISLDISNATDLEWKIDILKSSAALPPEFQSRVRKLASDVRQRAKSARKTYDPSPRRRGEKIQAEDAPMWVPSGKGAAAQFRLNRRHPLVMEIRELTKDSGRFKRMLDQIDQYVPVLPLASSKPIVPDPSRMLQEANIRKLVRVYYYSARRAQQLPHEQACEKLLTHPTFRDFEVLVMEEVDAYAKELGDG